ncbi:HlyD family secretion protein [Marinisporobacter balticus]|uniref:HlyD family secretion protein n=1 Tax=Marinisporobacter balticus TaxID=2018667 RepID=A0A4R2K8K2_9FIRM|nr:efflux RND transporter periplasmic adaptor subunit [Marinisporobacter balticus]TCO69701.1 HlyD family secretion protein [Marinisporobacter balticus]
MYKKFNVILLCMILGVFLSACDFNDIDSNIYTGTVECEDVDIISEVSAEITDIFVKEGELVKKGDRIAHIDVEDLKIELKKGEAGLKIVNAKLDKLRAGARSEEIKKAKVQVQKLEEISEGKESDYKFKLKNHEDIKKLFQEGIIAEKQLGEAKVLLDTAYADFESAKKEVESAQYTLDLITKGTRSEEIHMVLGEIDSAKATVDTIKYKISKGNIIAPIDGTVESLYYHEGEFIPAYGNMTNILDLKNLWVKIFIPEKEMEKISLQQEINMTADFMGNQKIKGKVIHISKKAEFTPKNIESKENKQEMVFAVKIEIMDDLEKLKPGMLIDIHLGGEKQ